MKTVLTALFISVLLVSLTAGIHIVKADSNAPIIFSSGLTIYSPLNTTYNSNFLTCNATFGCPMGIQSSLGYSIDGKDQGGLPISFNGVFLPPDYYLVGSFELPELSNGSHQLTINIVEYLYNYRGVLPSGIPFESTTPNGSDYVAYWVNTVYFTIGSSEVIPTSTPTSTFPTATVAAVSGASDVAIACVAILLYLRKNKH